MKERPILFSGPMVRAILDGRKTQTRRIVKPQPTQIVAAQCGSILSSEPDTRSARGARRARTENITCPYGVPGDRLWVREAHAHVHPILAEGRPSCPSTAGIPGPPGVSYAVVYRADGELAPLYHQSEHPYRTLNGAGDSMRSKTPWESPICMSRKYSRLTLEVVSVRVERLHAISESGAKAEGALSDVEMLAAAQMKPRGAEAARAVPSRLRSARDNFRDLWDGINSKRAPWQSNPRVWVVEFKRAA